MFRVVAVLLAVASAIKPASEGNVNLKVNAVAETEAAAHHEATQRRRVVQFVSRVRFCNAYVPDDNQDDAPLKVTVEMPGRDDIQLTKDSLKFKECHDFPHVALAEGYRFSVKSAKDGADLAEFIVTNFEHGADPFLMLVISRKSLEAREALFTSHQYSKLKNSQIVVMDLYNGSEDHNMSIRSTEKDNSGTLHMEQLTPNSVMAFDSDKEYEVVLADVEHNEQTSRFYAEKGNNYLMMSVGRAGSKFHSQPELVFFPNGAATNTVCVAFAVVLAYFI